MQIIVLHAKEIDNYLIVIVHNIIMMMVNKFTVLNVKIIVLLVINKDVHNVQEIELMHHNVYVKMDILKHLHNIVRNVLNNVILVLELPYYVLLAQELEKMHLSVIVLKVILKILIKIVSNVNLIAQIVINMDVCHVLVIEQDL